MAPEEQNEDRLRASLESPALYPRAHVMAGVDISSGADSSSLEFPTGCSSRSMFNDRSLHRRKSNARPRLPSFRGLGISPYEPPFAQDPPAHGTDCSGLERRSLERPCSRPTSTSSTRTSPPRTGSTPLLTPPADLDALKWTTGPIIRQSSPLSKPDTSAVIPIEPPASKTESASLSGNGPQADSVLLDPSGPSGTGGSESHQESTDNNTTQSSFESSESISWLDRSVGAAVMSIDPSNPSSNAIQIVSQTLPNPAKETARPNAIFTEVIAAIQTRFGTSPQPYITITHAVPPRFDLLNLPSSPPSTPNLFVGRDDYFTQSIFAHAAVVPSYHVTNNSLATPAPSSPNPIVPPSSVQISVLERYIPASSPQEGKDLFSLSGQSVLIDRLAELSPDRGSMLFVYPTRTGASTFTSRYLSHILDPLLRALIEVHQLSYGLAESLGSMDAVADMYDFGALKVRLSSLCRRMSHRITSETKRSNFNLVYAGSAEVAIDRRTWTEWYLKQEHARFKRTLETYWGRGKRLSQLDSASAGTMLREFIDGVNKMTNEEAEQTGPGIELGVFVVRRTLAASSS